jgi:hypothetical protein
MTPADLRRLHKYVLEIARQSTSRHRKKERSGLVCVAIN